MRTFYMLSLILFCLAPLLAQEECDPLVSCFDQPFLGFDEFQNDFSATGGFENGPAFYPNEYFTDFGGFWRSGWALSSKGDTITNAPSSIYSNITGSGASADPSQTGSGASVGSFQYIIGQDQSGIQVTSPDVKPVSIAITNTTYTYLNMRDGGNNFPVFGGADGTENDFLLLTIQGYNDGNVVPSTLEFYLADYRFLDNTRDYIVNKWEVIDLTTLGRVDSIGFTLTTNRMIDLDPNPLNYFAVDEVRFEFLSTLHAPLINYNLQVYPNPTSNKLQVESNVSTGNLLIFDTFGRQILQQTINSKSNTLEVNQLERGVYWLVLETDQGRQSRKFVKQ